LVRCRLLPAVAVLAVVPLAAGAQQPAVQPAPYVEQLPGMGRPIDTAATQGRRSRLMRHLGDAVVIVPAARAKNLETDYIQDNDFRQSNTFYYLTQLEQPAAWLLMSAHASGADTAVLLLPDRVPAQERWTGPKLGPGNLAAGLTGIPVVLSLTNLDSTIAALTARRAPIYVPLDQFARGLAPIDRLRADSTVTLRNLRPVVDSMRVVKDPDELAALRRAIAITTDAQQAAMERAEPGMFEYQLESVIEGTFRYEGADRVGFPTIIGSGPNSTILHYDVNRRQTRAGELVVMDIGAEYGYFTADVTRTIPISGTFTPRQREIYDLVLATQQATLDSVRPGITVGQLNQIARAYMREHSGRLCAPQTCDVYFIHGVGHWLGMDVHDAGDYRLALAPGAVITDEPGIYLPAESLGVRIEDDVLVTATGHELLSSAAPRRAEDVERLMQEARRARPAARRDREE
jgi:Xaa-Pro aminopeptidase